eukprot:12427107-Karenia_brevis.AAC.1
MGHRGLARAAYSEALDAAGGTWFRDPYAWSDERIFNHIGSAVRRCNAFIKTAKTVGNSTDAELAELAHREAKFEEARRNGVFEEIKRAHRSLWRWRRTLARRKRARKIHDEAKSLSGGW